MITPRGKILSFALSTALGLLAGQARAEVITITVISNGTSIVTTPLELPGATSSNVSIDVSLLNPLILASGYQFSRLGATSDFPGSTGNVGRHTEPQWSGLYSHQDDHRRHPIGYRDGKRLYRSDRTSGDIVELDHGEFHPGFGWIVHGLE